MIQRNLVADPFSSPALRLPAVHLAVSPLGVGVEGHMGQGGSTTAHTHEPDHMRACCIGPEIKELGSFQFNTLTFSQGSSSELSALLIPLHSKLTPSHGQFLLNLRA